MTTLSELFARDPNNCTRDDIKEIIKAYRERRAQFNLGNLSAGKVKEPTSKMKELSKEVNVELDL